MISKQVKECMEKLRSPDTIVQALAKQKLSALQRGLGPEQRRMIEKNLDMMKKRTQRMNKLASKSNSRRSDWINHTLDNLQTDLKTGQRDNLL